MTATAHPEPAHPEPEFSPPDPAHPHESGPTHVWRRLLAGAVLAILWLGCGLGSYVLQSFGGSIATLGRMLPSPMRGGFFGAPEGWAWSLHAIGVVVVITGYATIAGWFGRRMRVSFAAGWLAAVLTGFLIGAVLDLGNFIESVSWLGVRSSLGSMGATPMTVLWALLVGWLPALIVAGGFLGKAISSIHQRTSQASLGRARPGQARASQASVAQRVTNIVVAVVALGSVVALPIVNWGAGEAMQAQLRADQAAEEAEAEANADPGGAAPRDPDATGEPVPSVAPAEGTPSADTCNVLNSTILAPSGDAATGHRIQTLQLVNTSETACTVDGYPDVAFGDQNGHLLDVVIEHGDSFLAKDSGPNLVTIEPGESATAAIGWDANSMQRSLAARSLWVAAFAGAERLTWDVSLDIVPESTVYVTAWEPED